MPTLLSGTNEKNLGYLSLLILSIQSSTLTLLMKYSRSERPYNASVVVCLVELVKFLAALSMETILNQRFSIHRSLLIIRNDLTRKRADFVKLALPAALYAIQNNLCYLALKHLSAINYQVIYQMKIITTALFSVWLLGKKLKQGHWISLVLLMGGVILVQLAGNSSSGGKDQQSTLVGFLVLLFNSVSSGFAGVYFELLSKAPNSGTSFRGLRSRPRSIWIQSCELGIWGFLFSIVLAVFNSQGYTGLFEGFSVWTCATILLQSLGGILVAIVIRYADNIQKAFATSLSIVLCSMVSVILLGHQMPPKLLLGTALVVVAVILYARTSQTKPSKGLPRRVQSAQNL